MNPVGTLSTGWEPAVKRFRLGTHRVTDPADTLRRLEPLLADFGITRVGDVTGLDQVGIPVVMVCRPNSRSVAVSQGKGLTLTAAKVSGLMEAIELWHAERIEAPLVLASYAEMAQRYRVVDVNMLPRTANGLFHPHLPLLWIEGRDLLGDEPVWLPYESVHTNSTLPAPTGDGCFVSCSNGLASGNDILEAINHGISEVVERDATTLWRLRGGERSEEALVDLDSVPDPSCREALKKCAEAGLDVLVWDITSDIGIAAFACVITEESPTRHLRSTAMGMGCHPCSAVALLRAITEAAQSRLTLIAGSRDDLFYSDYEDTSQTAEGHGHYRALLTRPATRDFRNTPSRDHETLHGDVAWSLSRLSDAGIGEAIAVDLTRADFGLPVVRMVIPGLEAPDSVPGYLPGVRARAIVEGRT